jgi:outer membrane protein TolC
MERDFNAGTIGSSSMEDARQKVYDAEYRLLSAELSYWNTMLDLAAAINVDWKTLAGVL